MIITQHMNHLFQSLPNSQSLTLPNKIRPLTPNHINLPNQHRKPDHHRNRNDRQIDPRKLQPADSNMLPAQYIAPQHARQRRAKRQAKRAVIHSNRHAIHGAPEGAVGYRDVVLAVDFLPGLDDAGEEDCCADVCAGELFPRVSIIYGNGCMGWEWDVHYT